MIDSILLIDKFEQKCFVLKGIFQSPRLKYHVQTIGIDQSFSSNALYGHKCLQNIKKLYKHDGKCGNQKQLKNILEDAMVYNPEGFTNDSTIYPMTLIPVKKPSPIKSLCLFTNILDMKK